MKNALKLSAVLALVIAGCTTSSRPLEPWRIEVRTAGGITGRGLGTFAIDHLGTITVRGVDGKVCAYEATDAELRRIRALLAEARPREWKPSYTPENNCCDRIEYALFIDEASVITRTQWIDEPLPMPPDLVALSNAIVGGEGSIRATSGERCR